MSNDVLALPRRIIRREYPRYTAIAAGVLTLDLPVYEGEILAHALGRDITRALHSSFSYLQGGKTDFGVILAPLELQPAGEHRIVLYPFGRTRIYQGIVRVTFDSVLVGDVLDFSISVEEKFP